MSYKVSIDAGHGLYTSGKQSCKLTEDLYINGKLVRAKGKVIKENEFNSFCAKALASALQRHGIQTKFVNDITGKTDTSLNTRAINANKWGSDIHISIHYNAIGSCSSWQNKCHGVLVLRTANCSTKSITLANKVHSAIKGNYSHTYGVGVDKNWSGFTLAILRQTKMPAILIEYGFMDYKEEAMKMLNPNWYVKLAEDTCKGICDYFGIKYKAPNTTPNEIQTSTSGNTYYRVVCGSYVSKDNANKELAKVKALGYDAFLVAFILNSVTYYRVVATSMKNKANAQTEVEILRAKGFDAFISIYNA